MGQSGVESALDTSDIDSGWDLIGDLREALPDAATNGAAEGGAPLIDVLRLVSPVPACSRAMRETRWKPCLVVSALRAGYGVECVLAMHRDAEVLLGSTSTLRVASA